MTEHWKSLLWSVLRSARVSPDRPAVRDAWGGTLTYVQLVRRATILSEELRERGVAPGDRVGVVLEPGAEAVTALVAALMLRAAYVPVDPEQPERRIRTMLENCGARAWVTGDGYGLADARIVSTGHLATTPLADAGSDQSGFAETRPKDIAYVIHTSGSTGTPKGVQVEHCGVINLLGELDRLAPVTDGVKGSWWTRPSFDVSVWESWAPLWRGGTVVVVPPECRLEGPSLAAFLDAVEIESAYVPAAFLPDLLNYLEADERSCGKLVRLLVGVEPIPRGLLQTIRELRPNVTVVNGYGPAETTICSTLYTVPRTGGSWAERTPIGSAVSGNRLYVVDENGRPSPSGAGELIVAGVGVARGYLNASEADGERFIREPGGGRAYCTGDLVRTLPDGNLVFEGRVDRQLKVRGYRIEPGEVEAAVREVAAVRDVVIGCRAGSGDDARLIAYVVPQDGAKVDQRSLKVGLRAVLPRYAVPSSVVIVDRIPLTTNGKIDHDALAALPLPIAKHSLADPAGGAGSRDHLSAVLLAWTDVLGTTDVRPEDSFTAAGGTSLDAARVAAALRDATGREISAGDVLSAPTAESLADRLAEACTITVPPESEARGRDQARLSPGQTGLWVHDQMSDRSADYVETVCFRLHGDLDTDRLASAVSRAAAAHPAFGATVPTECGRPRLRLGRREPELTVLELDPALSDADVDRLLRHEATTPFDLATGPLMRCLIIRHGTGGVLLLSWHHLVVDGWSVRLFLRDLATCYRDPRLEPESESVPLTLCDLNERQVREAQGARSRRRAEDAAARLRGVPLEITWPGGAKGSGRCAAVPIQLPAGLVRRVRRAASQSELTVSAVACAAYQRTLAVALRLEHFLLGCAVSGRTRPETQAIAGYLVNTILLRCEQPLGAATDVFARSAAAELASAISFQEIPFPHVARHLFHGTGQRSESFPQLYFSIDEEPELHLQGLECRRHPLHPARAKFDVTLSLQHGSGGLSGVLEYRHSALSPEAAAALAGTFHNELSAFADAVLGTVGGTPESRRGDLVHS